MDMTVVVYVVKSCVPNVFLLESDTLASDTFSWILLTIKWSRGGQTDMVKYALRKDTYSPTHQA